MTFKLKGEKKELTKAATTLYTQLCVQILKRKFFLANFRICPRHPLGNLMLRGISK